MIFKNKDQNNGNNQHTSKINKPTQRCEWKNNDKVMYIQINVMSDGGISHVGTYPAHIIEIFPEDVVSTNNNYTIELCYKYSDNCVVTCSTIIFRDIFYYITDKDDQICSVILNENKIPNYDYKGRDSFHWPPFRHTEYCESIT